MEEEHWRILRANFVEIRRVLDPDKVLPYFIQKNVMSDEEVAEIRAQKTRHKKVDVLIDVLKRSNKRAFDVFVEALEKEQEQLACLFLRSELREKNETNERLMMRQLQVESQLKKEATVLKGTCEQLERQLKEATRHQPESTPDSVDGATSSDFVLVRGQKSRTTSGFDFNLKKGVVTDLHLASLAQEIASDWMKIGFALGLKRNQLEAIKENHQGDVNEQSTSMLFKWQHKQGGQATYENLAEALDIELVQRRDLVEKYCWEPYYKNRDAEKRGEKDLD